MKQPSEKQRHICQLWCIEAGDRYTGSTITDDGMMIVYVLQKAVTMSTMTIVPMRFMYDSEGKLIDCFTPGLR